ncbi:MAG TPA: hypothetical protein VL092_11045 [Chitinophagaceae bacterium]|nr:hypothetical protein [Chitinophagaceae bacterium]
MPLLKFRVYWEEDDLIYRDIEIVSSQTFFDLHTAIIKAYDFDGKHTALFFESNDKWERFRVFSSEVTANKKDAPALSMSKTPVSALVAVPDQKFIYEYDPVKKWTFLVELIGISNDINERKTYPLCSRKEGMAPSQYKIGGGTGLLMEVEEKYDLGADEMAEGFGSEGNDEGGSDEAEESYDSSSEEQY